MPRGTVKKKFDDKSFGFIILDVNGDGDFVHRKRSHETPGKALDV